MLLNKVKILFIIFFCIGWFKSEAQTIIVNINNPITSISKGKLRNIFLGNKNVWSSGKLIQLADYNSENKLRKQFSDKILNRSPRKVSMIWIKVSLSGKSLPPRILRNSDEIIDFVKNNEGAIAYIEQVSKFPKQIKVLKIE